MNLEQVRQGKDTRKRAVEKFAITCTVSKRKIEIF